MSKQKQKSIKKLMGIYKNDIDVDIFEDEFKQFLLFLKKNKDTIKTIPDIHKVAEEMSCTFANVEVLLYLFTTISLSNA